MESVALVSASETEMVQRRVVMPSMLNPNGTMFGGGVVCFFVVCCCMVGLGFVKGKILTVSVENGAFSRPIYEGETIVIRGRVVYTGRTSFAVRLDTDVERNGVFVGNAGNAMFHYVAIDDNRRPVPVPQLLLETEEDRRMWEEAETGRRIRKK